MIPLTNLDRLTSRGNLHVVFERMHNNACRRVPTAHGTKG